jgi:putative transposase
MFFMPWEETNTMTERMKFIIDFESGEETLAELCRQYGIQRRIGYKWLKRFDELGPAGLSDRARAPRTHPNQTPDNMVRRILKVRGDHPLWGAEDRHRRRSRQVSGVVRAEPYVGTPDRHG